jgi:hypothetical protein
VLYHLLLFNVSQRSTSKRLSSTQLDWRDWLTGRAARSSMWSSLCMLARARACVRARVCICLVCACPHCLLRSGSRTESIRGIMPKRLASCHSRMKIACVRLAGRKQSTKSCRNYELPAATGFTVIGVINAPFLGSSLLTNTVHKYQIGSKSQRKTAVSDR